MQGKEMGFSFSQEIWVERDQFTIGSKATMLKCKSIVILDGKTNWKNKGSKSR